MKRFQFSFVLLLGLVLLIAGIIGLTGGPAVVQYAFLPPADSTGLLKSFTDLQAAQAASFPLLTIHGQKSGVTLSAGSASQNDVTLYLTGPAWHEVYPRRYLAGRPISRMDVEQGGKVIVLDQETAFLFFGEKDPLGQTVTLEGESLEVVGVAAHSRRIGETGKAAAWAPLGLKTDCDLMALSAPVTADSSLLSAFQTAAAEAFGAGTLISLPKEGARATMILRWTGLILALWGLLRGIRWYRRYARRQWIRIREESRRRYAGRLLPYALGQLLPVGLLGAGAIGIGAVLAILAVNPAQVFPEWVPESLGDFSAWAARFWNLTAEAGKPVTLKTPELAEVRFWGALVRWGTVLTLLSQWKGFFPGKGKDDSGPGNRADLKS